MTDFSQNLRTVFAYYPSISEISRQLKINRQQLNRYLNGKSTPSLYTLKKMSDFFSIDETEFFLPNDEFKMIFSSEGDYKLPDKIKSSIHQFFKPPSGSKEAGQENSKYCGKYFTYSMHPYSRGKILKSIMSIYQEDERTYAKTLIPSSVTEKDNRRLPMGKVNSFVNIEHDKLYFFDMGEQGSTCPNYSMTVFYTSFQARPEYLVGITLNAQSRLSRNIASSQVVMEYLGPGKITKDDILRTGIYCMKTDHIASNIMEILLGNETNEEAFPNSIRI